MRVQREKRGSRTFRRDGISVGTVLTVTFVAVGANPFFCALFRVSRLNCNRSCIRARSSGRMRVKRVLIAGLALSRAQSAAMSCGNTWHGFKPVRSRRGKKKRKGSRGFRGRLRVRESFGRVGVRVRFRFRFRVRVRVPIKSGGKYG